MFILSFFCKATWTVWLIFWKILVAVQSRFYVPVVAWKRSFHVGGISYIVLSILESNQQLCLFDVLVICKLVLKGWIVFLPRVVNKCRQPIESPATFKTFRGGSRVSCWGQQPPTQALSAKMCVKMKELGLVLWEGCWVDGKFCM